MSGGNDNQTGDVRYYAPRVGVVTNNKDPKKLGRVKFRIPGLVEPEGGWAWPLGAPGGGSKKRGLKFTPAEGAEIMVFFNGGDPNDPRYVSAHWGAPKGVTEMLDATADADVTPDDAPKIIELQGDRFHIVIDEREGHETLRFEDMVTGDKIEMDGTKATGPGITIQATAAVYFKVDGQFIVDALDVVMNGRRLANGGQEF